MSNETTTASEPELLPEAEPADMVPARDRGEDQRSERPRPQPVARMDESEGAAAARVIVRMSEHVNELFAAIAAAQGEDGYGEVERTRTARVQSAKANYAYDYETLEDVLAATRPFLAKHGVAVMQFPMPGARSVTVRTMLGHSSGQWLTNDMACSIASTAPQDIASGITFMCRYALKAICGVAAGYDDDGAAASGLNRQPRPEPAKAAPRKSESAAGRGDGPAGHSTQRSGANEASNTQAAQPAAASQVPYIGKITDGPAENGGAYYVRLDTGFRCATRDPELVKALEGHRASGAVVELTCRAPRDPKYAPTLEEITIQRGRG